MTVKCFRFLRFPSLLFACMNAAGNFFSLYCSPHPLCPFSTGAATSLEVALNWTSPDPTSYCLLAQGSCLTPSRLSLFYGNFKIQVERFQNTEMGEKGGREDVSLALVVTCKIEELYGIHVLHCELKNRQSRLTARERQKT